MIKRTLVHVFPTHSFTDRSLSPGEIWVSMETGGGVFPRNMSAWGGGAEGRDAGHELSTE